MPSAPTRCSEKREAEAEGEASSSNSPPVKEEPPTHRCGCSPGKGASPPVHEGGTEGVHTPESNWGPEERREEAAEAQEEAREEREWEREEGEFEEEP